ncbi:MAG: CPBP family intramembrane glutamic endopeptidase [Terracidiphilus sp.]
MPNDIAVPEESSTEEAAPPDLARNGKALRWFELSLVLVVCFSSSLLASFRFLTNGADAAQPRQSADWGYLLFQEIIGLLLLGYVLWRRRMTFRDLGLSWSPGDPLAGILVAVAAYFSYVVGYTLIHLANQTFFHTAAQAGSVARQIFGHPTLLSIPLLFLNPLFEELIVRAYLMKEIRELTGSWLLAGAVSVAIQTAYHLYYGWVGALCLGFQFLVFSIYYANKRRATPIVVAHCIFDVWAMSRLW